MSAPPPRTSHLPQCTSVRRAPSHTLDHADTYTYLHSHAHKHLHAHTCTRTHLHAHSCTHRHPPFTPSPGLRMESGPQARQPLTALPSPTQSPFLSNWPRKKGRLLSPGRPSHSGKVQPDLRLRPQHRRHRAQGSPGFPRDGSEEGGTGAWRKDSDHGAVGGHPTWASVSSESRISRSAGCIWVSGAGSRECAEGGDGAPGTGLSAGEARQLPQLWAQPVCGTSVREGRPRGGWTCHRFWTLLQKHAMLEAQGRSLQTRK